MKIWMNVLYKRICYETGELSFKTLYNKTSSLKWFIVWYDRTNLFDGIEQICIFVSNKFYGYGIRKCNSSCGLSTNYTN